MRRDFVWDPPGSKLAYVAIGLYALRRDFVWNDPEQKLIHGLVLTFLYALRRDFVWNQPIITELYTYEQPFLYALRRDFVWNPTPSEGSVTSADLTGCAGDLRKYLRRAVFTGCRPGPSEAARSLPG